MSQSRSAVSPRRQKRKKWETNNDKTNAKYKTTDAQTKHCNRGIPSSVGKLLRGLNQFLALNSFTAIVDNSRLRKQHRSRWDGSYEPSHLNLRWLTFSPSTLHTNVFQSDSLLTYKKAEDKRRLKFGTERVNSCAAPNYNYMLGCQLRTIKVKHM